MNRVLSWPHTPIFPGLLESLKGARAQTVVTDKGMIRFDLPLGVVEMKFSQPAQHLAAGTEVYVWWKRGGFVCAPAAELDREEREARGLAERLAQARSQLAEARRERVRRLAENIDIVLPGDAAPALRLVS